MIIRHKNWEPVASKQFGYGTMILWRRKKDGKLYKQYIRYGEFTLDEIKGRICR